MDLDTAETPSLRDSIEAAAESLSAPAETPETPPAPVEAPPDVEAEAAPAEPPDASPQRNRDEAGRFAKGKAASAASEGKQPAVPEAKPPSNVATSPKEAAPVAPAAPTLKAPQSWKPQARESWAKLPAEVQAEVHRREVEVSRVLSETAADRKAAAEFRQAVAPFEAHIRAEGSHPLQAIGNLLQTALALRTAPPAHKAALVASMVKAYGVPIDALDAALVGQPQSAPQHAPQPQSAPMSADAIVAQVRQQLEGERAQSEVAKFFSTHEFAEELRADMADLVELAHRRGVTLTLDEAYSRAVAANPDVSAVLRQREAAKSPGVPAKVPTQRARLAASSVKSSPASAPGAREEPKDLRGAIAAAFEAAERT